MERERNSCRESFATAVLSGNGGCMSGFLNSLVARNLGRAPTIRPRPASLFEPARGNVALFSEFSGQAKQGETISMDETKLEAGGPQDSREGESNFQPKRRDWTAPQLTPLESDESLGLTVSLPATT